MPPRRSSRSTRASVEVQEDVKPALPKRKRTETAEPVADQENIKPASRMRRSTSASVAAPVPAPKKSTRSKKSLEGVIEIDDDDEEHEAPPPVRKKPRPSMEVDGLEEIEPEDVKPSTGRKGPARKSSRVKAVLSSGTNDEGTSSAGRKPPSARRGRTSTRASSRATTRIKHEDSADNEDETQDIDVSDEEPEVKVKQERRKPASKVVVSDEEGEEDDPSVSAGRQTSRRPHASRSLSKEEVPIPEIQLASDRSDDDEPIPTANKEDELSEEESHEDAAPLAGAEPEDARHPTPEEEEHSLLDPPISPDLQSQPQVQPTIPEEPQGPKPRLVIHKMALVNFKSYAGRQEIGPFHKSFSAIVGPNGSGKSNTIDALLFVFGYRASKMRQGKLSELIHNSARYPDLDECSVEIHFREIIDLPGPDEFEIVPDSTLVVARAAYKNNSSRYTINGQQSNYKEVQTLLKGRGIDLDHNRFLILQGEVESIAQMKPKAATEHEDGLLEYLEDIIGTSQYKEPIDEALVEMERLSEERAEKMNRLRIVERERKALEEKKREAEDYLRLQNEHIRALSRLWQWYIWRCLTNDEQYQDRILQIEAELAEETDQNKDDIAHLEALEKHFKERCAAYEELKKAAAEALKDLALHEKKQVGLEERRKHANGKLKKLKKSLQDDEHALAEARRSVDDNGKKMISEREKVEEFETSLAKEEKVLEDIRDSLKDKTQVFHDKIEIKQKELQPWTTKINSKQAEIDLATSERDALAKKAEGIKAAHKEAQEALEKLQEDQEAKAAEIKELKVKKSTQQKDLQAGERELQEARARVQELRGSASSLRQKAEEAKASQAANTSQNKVLDSLTRLKQAGRISGFHGRLGSLGTIPDKYDVAVSTACGALNNLVVDTVEQGQACIEYLRKQNVGRASFLVLEKLSRNGLDRIDTPENVPRLFDLIKPKEPRFAPAFFKGVGNTLVAEDLEQANRIAFGGQRRWRVVTLAGQLIDSSGTMSGGGHQVARGGMSSKLAAESVSPDVLKKYERDSEQAAQELEQALRRLRDLEAQMEQLGHSGPQVDIAIEKVNLDIQTGAKRIAEAEKRVRELKSQSKPDARDMARITSLEEQISQFEAELEELQEKTGAIEGEIKALEKKILEIGGARLLSQKSKVDGIRLHINLANDEITKAEVAKSKAEKDSLKLQKSIATNNESLQEVDGELEELNEQLEECTAYVNEIRSKVDQAQSVAEKSKDDMDNLKAELDEKTEGIQAFRQKEMELQQALNDINKEAAENKRSLDHWIAEHDNLKLEEIDDEDDDEAEAEVAPGPAEDGEPPVKPDPEGGSSSRRRREKTPSHELHTYSAEELATFKKRELIADAELLDEKLKNAKPDLRVLKDYRKREEEFLRRAQDLDQVTTQRDAKKQEYDNLRKQRLDEFMSGFNAISLKLKEMYQMITLGGNAELELVDSMDPFSEGIIFSVMPPKKSWKNISNLSGGEKTLSSLALVFALHVYKPTPLYFMDEIDAALDFRNVSIVANYIKDRTKNAQFIIISLRNDMFELSHRLIGIYKTANATRSISIDNHALHTVPVNTVAA